MNRSESIKELAAALAKAQGEFKPAVFDSVNPHFKSKYASLTSVMDSVRATLSKHGLSITQIVNGEQIETVLMHASGEMISGIINLKAERENMQGLGSAITYAKRYAISAMLGVVSDEDYDAEGNVRPPQTAQQPQRPAAQAPAHAIKTVTTAQPRVVVK